MSKSNVINYTPSVDVRAYCLVEIKGHVQLAVHTRNGWTIDATCESINSLLRDGLVCPESIQGWIDRRILHS